MNDTRLTAYAQRFGRVFDYIDTHLNDELSVERLSAVANFSKFHFHRQFTEYAGVTVARYVQLMRMRRASYRLVFNPEARITDIAQEAGFENSESFSRAFKGTFGQTPSQFRSEPAWQLWNDHYRAIKRKESTIMKEVNVIQFQETPVAVLEHWGSPARVNETVRTFCQWRQRNSHFPAAGGDTFGIVYNDPETTTPEQFHFDICGSVTAPIPENDLGVITKVIPEGRCAVIRHIGSRDQLADSAYYLYREWLPCSSEELRDFPLFLQYLNFMPETPEHELITDVYLPLK